MKRALLALALLAGCGDATAIAIEDYNAALARADCEWAVRCGQYDTLDRCLAASHPTGPITPSIAGAVIAQIVTYDGVQAAQCVAEHASMSCALVDEVPRIEPTVICRGVLRSDKITGMPCEIDAECQSRSCSSGTTPEACNLGSCVEPVHVAALGEDCSTVACSPDSWCAPFVNTCLPLEREGAACTDAHQCGFGLDCFDTCQPPPHLGDPCPRLLGLPTCGNTVGMACDLATGACAAPLGLGAACDPDDDRCQSGWLECARDRRVCVPFPAVGEPCDQPYRCADGALCTFSGEGTTGICLPLVDDGSPCSGQDQLCASGVCDNVSETCVEPMTCV